MLARKKIREGGWGEHTSVLRSASEMVVTTVNRPNVLGLQL